MGSEQMAIYTQPSGRVAQILHDVVADTTFTIGKENNDQ